MRQLASFNKKKAKTSTWIVFVLKVLRDIFPLNYISKNRMNILSGKNWNWALGSFKLQRLWLTELRFSWRTSFLDKRYEILFVKMFSFAHKFVHKTHFNQEFPTQNYNFLSSTKSVLCWQIGKEWCISEIWSSALLACCFPFSKKSQYSCWN